jgi:predicted pyridoxine 5'-phosphate oxidase superfamily flavin-nucleotide-binding protein
LRPGVFTRGEILNSEKNDKISGKIKKLLEAAEFIDIATADSRGQPNAAPKFLIKCESSKLYVADCVMDRTWENIKINKRVSVPIMDIDTLLGYRVNGTASIIEEGRQRSKLLAEFADKQIKLSTARVVEGIRRQTSKCNLEVNFPDVLGILVIDVESVVEIGPTGRLVCQEQEKEAL